MKRRILLSALIVAVCIGTLARPVVADAPDNSGCPSGEAGWLAVTVTPFDDPDRNGDGIVCLGVAQRPIGPVIPVLMIDNNVSGN
jgi:hypothetical protein